jgi:hypothetical protein
VVEAVEAREVERTDCMAPWAVTVVLVAMATVLVAMIWLVWVESAVESVLTIALTLPTLLCVTVSESVPIQRH